MSEVVLTCEGYTYHIDLSRMVQTSESGGLVEAAAAAVVGLIMLIPQALHWQPVRAAAASALAASESSVANTKALKAHKFRAPAKRMHIGVLLGVA